MSRQSYRRNPELDSEILRQSVPPPQPIAAESALAICTYSAPSEISPRRETLRPTHPTPENQKPFSTHRDILSPNAQTSFLNRPVENAETERGRVADGTD